MQEASQHLANIYHKKLMVLATGRKHNNSKNVFLPVQLFACCESQNVPWAVLSGRGVEQMLIVGGGSETYWIPMCFTAEAGWLQMKLARCSKWRQRWLIWFSIGSWWVAKLYFSPAQRGFILCFSGFSGYRTQKNHQMCFSLVLFGPHRFILSLGHPIFWM